MSDLDDSDIELEEEYEEKKNTKKDNTKSMSKDNKKKVIKQYTIDSDDNGGDDDADETVDVDVNSEQDNGDDDDDDDDDVDENDDDDDDDEQDDDDDDDDEILNEYADEININTQSEKPDNINDGIDISPVNSDIEEDEQYYLQKIDEDYRDDYIKQVHPESLTKNAVEIDILCQIKRDVNNNIIDDLHKTQPFLSKYEKTRILGQRAKQINMGDDTYIDVPKDVIDGYLIAEMELKQKKIPVIIRRPLPNGSSEYWKLSDLELL
tara:strand:+ start:3925 stop:4719 length:795 start_codon:yes stop_codon:yes gene_type:complete